MEAECAKSLWKRSDEKLKLIYTVILSDGDSEAFDNLIAVNPYQPIHMTTLKLIRKIV